LLVTPPRRLVFVSPRFLFPADSGGKIRTTQILRGLKGGAFQITLVMPATAAERAQWAAQIDGVCDEHVGWQAAGRPGGPPFIRKAIRLFHRYPIPVISDWDEEGAATVAGALQSRPDAVVFDFPHSAVLAPGRIDMPSVMFTHNIEAEIFERHWQVARFPLRWLWRNQFLKMRRYEHETLAAFDTVIAVSERDCAFFRERYGIKHCGAIPTGVDTDFFAYRPPEGEPQVVFCGSMDWMANIDGIQYFADEVWPLIRRQVPGARMKVVGRTPPDALVRRVRNNAPEWEFTGFVDDVRDHIAGAAAFVIPLRVGGGTRIKAFEAMAMGAPVVSTSIGIEGLPVEDGKHFLGADEPERFAAQVVSLLTDDALRQRLSRAARELVAERFGFKLAAQVFENLCSETVDRVAPIDTAKNHGSVQ
jgi:glycosyltransferase involved in cell wall biosynthesis